MLCTNATCRVLHRGFLSEKIHVRTGVKQGCVLSPLLFNIVLDYVLTEVDIFSNGIIWDAQNKPRLGNLDYADDIDLLSHTFIDMMNILQRLEAKAATVGLSINTHKTKEMRIGTNNSNKFRIQDTEIEQVKAFCYLGYMVTINGGTAEDVAYKISKTRQAFCVPKKHLVS